VNDPLPLHPIEYDPTEKNAQAAEARQLEAQARKIMRIYKRVFDNPDGQYVLRDMMRMSHFYDPLFKGGEVYEPYTAARREGTRELFLYVLRTAQATEENFRTIREVTL
jgi:hypothetical protein